MTTPTTTPHNPNSAEGVPPSDFPQGSPTSRGGKTSAFLRDLARKWLCPDAGAPLRVVARGRLAADRLGYVQIETLHAGCPLALYFFQSRRIGSPWAVMPDRCF